MKNYLQKQAAKSLFIHCRKIKVSVGTLRMSVTVRQSSSFHILTHRHHPFNFAPRSPSRRNVIDLVDQSHDKKLGRLRIQAIIQTADDGMYVITRGCSQMSRVPQKINNIVEIFSFINGCRLRTPNVRGEGGRFNVDKGGGGSKIGKILRTSFMYDLLQ